MANKNKRCVNCKDYKDQSTMRKLVAGWFCSVDCTMAYVQKKNQKAAVKKRAREKRDTRERLKTTRDRMKEAQTAVNRYIRARDRGKGCISCGSMPEQKRGGTMDAGHYRSRGAAGHMRFNVFNINSQCVSCNRYQSGNVVDYRIRLIEKIGLERVESLEHDNDPRKFTSEYLDRVKRIFSKRARVIEKRNAASESL